MTNGMQSQQPQVLPARAFHLTALTAKGCMGGGVAGRVTTCMPMPTRTAVFIPHIVSD